MAEINVYESMSIILNSTIKIKTMSFSAKEVKTTNLRVTAKQKDPKDMIKLIINTLQAPFQLIMKSNYLNLIKKNFENGTKELWKNRLATASQSSEIKFQTIS